MPLCVLIYGGCQYQQNVIYCIKMRILLLLQVSPVRVTRDREPQHFLRSEHFNTLIVNTPVSLEAVRVKAARLMNAGTGTLLSPGCRGQLMLTNCQSAVSSSCTIAPYPGVSQCLPSPGPSRAFASQIEKVVSMDQT